MKLTEKLIKTLICSTFFFIVTGFSAYSDLKQNDEYSCAPVAAANCATGILNQNFQPDTIIQMFSKLAKTDNNGTTAQNLCSALETFFLKTNLKTNIKYYGIRKVERKYNSKEAINVCKELLNGSSVILNFGIYKKQGNTYKRTYGHYVNAYECKGSKILIADPYSKNEPRYIELTRMEKIRLKNTSDSEKYSLRRYDYYEISPAFEYQANDEKAILNGIIKVYPLYL